MKTRLFHVMLVLVGIALVGLPVAQAYFADVQLGSAISLGLVLSLAYATVVRVSNIWADGISNMRRTFAIIGTIAGIAGPIVAAMATSLPNGSKGAIAAGFIAALLASWKAAFGNAGAASPVDPKAGVLLALVVGGLLFATPAQAQTPQLGTCIDAGNTWCVQPATAVGWQINLKTGDVKNAAVLVGYSIVHQTGFAIGAGLYGGVGLAADGPNAPQGHLLLSLSNFGAVGIGAQRAKFADGVVAWQAVVTVAATMQFGGSPSYLRRD